jgi:D-inositol-3-phosphate glycosyltransferase
MTGRVATGKSTSGRAPARNARAAPRERLPRRVATLSVHTSPLDQPGAGDAGGMNVYISEVAKRLADRGVEVDIFTRATASALPPVVEMHPGVTVRHVDAGPYEGLGKNDLPAQLCAFAAAVLRVEASHEPGWYDAIHSHYWLSGQVGWLARERWGVPLVHSAHTLAKVKNAALAAGDAPEPLARIVGEQQVVREADRLVAATPDEARQLIEMYGAPAGKVVTVPPGVDLELFRLASASTARTRLGIPPDALVLLFVGRIQPLKGPDVLLRAVAAMIHGAADESRNGSDERRRELVARLQVLVVGAPSGSGLRQPEALQKLAADLGLANIVRFVPPVRPQELALYYQAADLTAVPSHSESFGLVALESQACGTPVVAAAVGGLTTAVRDGVSGVLVPGHDPALWARTLNDLLVDPARRAALGGAARPHAERFSWSRTADGLLDTYRDAMADFPFPAAATSQPPRAASAPASVAAR